ncbi:UNVERIFIED_CONTAM: Homeobox protein knotted-1-like 1 [Sesamum radiatum]|uniref:Homeobox protein knotted-1-like 1 n=1 Tax=Sesamum radiatum TaxID=300843 RepID=A0AAW2U7J6_SESRA
MRRRTQNESRDLSRRREGDWELKEMLMRKYRGYLSSLRKEFLKERKKGKLPKDARVALLEWWNEHYKWPYPTVISIYSSVYGFVAAQLHASCTAF